jgi:manganese transport protein
MSQRTALAGQAVLAGRIAGIRRFLPFIGPAVIASIAYMDPGNFATNIQAGAGYGYNLLWVVVLANVVAMLFQAQSAKLGIVTGSNLAELCRQHFPKPVAYAMWVWSEIGAMATDLAEFLGAAVGLSLLFGLPLLVSVLITGCFAYILLVFQGSGFRLIEIAMFAFVAMIGVSYLIELIIAPPDWAAVLRHSFTPRLDDAGAVTLAVGIIGATVMPHAIFLHSSLTQNRIPAANDAERAQIIRYSNYEVLVALGIAGFINLAMVTMAAVVFHFSGHGDVAEIETAYLTLIPLMGVGAAAAFMLSLLASGLSSSVVGTMAGQVIMQGFVGFSIPIWVRRLVTMIPAVIVVALGVNATEALVISQAILSLVLPVPMIATTIFATRRDVMGQFAVGGVMRLAMIAATIIVVTLNLILLLQLAGVDVPLSL